MAQQTDYLKIILASNANLAFIGLMVFLSLVFNWGYLFLLLAAELGLFVLSQVGLVQRWIDTKEEERRRKQLEQAERSLVASLPVQYRQDYEGVAHLCEEIEKRANELMLETMSSDAAASVVISGIVDKLSSFRSEYVRILKAHSLLSTRNYQSVRKRLEADIAKAEQEIQKESSQQVKATMMQNLKILRQRSSKSQQLEELVRLLEIKIQIVRNSLRLIQDELYSMTNVRSISEIVDGMLVNLQLNEEFRNYYNDALNLDFESENLVLEPDWDQLIKRQKVVE
ncbi:MAG: hypothetical protein RMM17_13785 [Acidobacteriota bacterium]|nr:hypothetical protein [Blastocatellia bacterium]MDW8413739.1 hypothetical protein [Acidobacteriota bacterium]